MSSNRALLRSSHCKKLQECESLSNTQAAAEPAVVRPADEDEDIFGDAGKDYRAELPKSRDGGAAASTRGQYFAEKDDMADLPALPTAGLHLDLQVSYAALMKFAAKCYKV